MRSPNLHLSTVRTWETLTTLCSGRPASPGTRSTLPGSPARRRFDVRAHVTTVRIPLLLNRLFWTTTKGRGYPGEEPSGSPTSTQKTSP